MRRRVAWVVFGMLLLVVVLAMAWWSWPEIAPSTTGIDVRSSPGPLKAATSDTGAADAEAVVAREPRAAVDAGAAVDPEPPPRIFGNVTLDVMVVDGKTGAPKPDATVWFWDEATQQTVCDLPPDDPQLAAGHRRSVLRSKFGRSLVTDANGRVQVVGLDTGGRPARATMLQGGCTDRRGLASVVAADVGPPVYAGPASAAEPHPECTSKSASTPRSACVRVLGQRGTRCWTARSSAPTRHFDHPEFNATDQGGPELH